MREEIGDLWQRHATGYWVAITTNGIVRRDGACVMGRGVAREAANRLGGVAREIGTALTARGNHVIVLHHHRLLTFPVKEHWRDRADLSLIQRSARELVEAVVLDRTIRSPVYLVRPGCGNGGQRWEDVRPLIAPFLDDRFIVIERG